MTKNFQLKNIFFYFIKICFCLVKNFYFSIFSKRATRIFFILPILETSDLLFSYSIGILNGHPKFEMFLVLTSVNYLMFSKKTLKTFSRCNTKADNAGLPRKGMQVRSSHNDLVSRFFYSDSSSHRNEQLRIRQRTLSSDHES